MLKFLICFVVVCVLSGCVNAHTYHGGRCSKIEPMPSFVMSKFLGMWFAIEKTTTDSTCLTYNVTVGEEPGQYVVDQVSHNNVFEFYRYTGKISIPEANKPGHMRVKFPLNIFGSSSFTVFSTDYDTYAGIFTCQNLGLFHRLSATLLSRSPTLDQKYVDRMHNFLTSHEIDVSDLKAISHTACFAERNDDMHHEYINGNRNGYNNHGTDAEVVELGVSPNLDHDAEWIRF